jgi:hypothetical protein
MAENSTPKQRGKGKPFAPGQSGNPRGKPRGTRHRATVFAEKLMQADVADVVRTVTTAAKGGDMSAARLVLDRVLPPRKGCTVRFDLPAVSTPADVVAALGAVLAAVGRGELTPDEGAVLTGLLETKRKALETVELEGRIAALEQRAAR